MPLAGRARLSSYLPHIAEAKRIRNCFTSPTTLAPLSRFLDSEQR